MSEQHDNNLSRVVVVSPPPADDERHNKKRCVTATTGAPPPPSRRPRCPVRVAGLAAAGVSTLPVPNVAHVVVQPLLLLVAAVPVSVPPVSVPVIVPVPPAAAAGPLLLLRPVAAATIVPLRLLFLPLVSSRTCIALLLPRLPVAAPRDAFVGDLVAEKSSLPSGQHLHVTAPPTCVDPLGSHGRGVAAGLRRLAVRIT